MDETKISVIIPCYNSEKTIEETLSSLETSADLIYEVICVDDGSADKTLEILNAYALRSSLNINIISGENAGVSVARNKGIDASLGDVLLFLDADDKYSPSFIRSVRDNCPKYDTVYGYFTRNENELGSAFDAEDASAKDIISVQTEFMVNKERCHTAAFSYSKQIIDSFGLRFTPGARYGEDWEFTTKYLSACSKALCLCKRILFYRDSESSVIKSPTYAHVHAIDAAVRTEEFLKESKSAFYEEFCSYMRHRAVFSVAHNFSKFARKDLFDKLVSEYRVKESMLAIVKNKHTGFKIKLAAFSYVLSSKLFFYLVGRI